MASYLKKVQDAKQATKSRFSALCKFIEYGTKDEVKQFFSSSFSDVYKIFLDHLQALDTTAKQKKKTIGTSEVMQLSSLLLNLFKHARNVIQKKWQQRSLVHYLEAFLVDTNEYKIRKTGFELLLHFVDIMQDQTDMKVQDLVMHLMDFKMYIEPNAPVKLPNFEARELMEEEKLRIEQAKTPMGEQENYDLFIMFFNFIKTGEQFEYWWKFFKLRIAPILYPNECKSLNLLNKLDDMGFAQRCPHKLHLLVLDMILDSLESPKKSDVLYQSDTDIYLFLLIFRQSFLLPAQHFENNLTRMLKTYRSWICKDYFLYSWPQIMEKSRNFYFRIFIDNLSQTFFMKGEEQYLDIHMTMCYEVFEIFMFFINIEEKLEFETWSDLLMALIRIYGHLMKCTASSDKYENEFGKLLERTCVRNLFVLWLRAHPDGKYTELWDAFYEMLRVQFNTESTFTYWRSTVINLTTMVLKSVFGLPDDAMAPFLNYDTEIYEFKKKNKKVTYTPKPSPADLKPYFTQLNQNLILHLWHKMLFMFGSDNAVTSSGSLHSLKIKVISDVIDMLLQISHLEIKPSKGSNAASFIHAPEANRILDLFGEWLIEACCREDQGFAEGRYSAYASLCKIICQKCSQPVKNRYLAEFYRVIHLGLTTSSTPKIIEAIVLNSTRIFCMGHLGANMLIPDYLKAIEPILRDNSSASDALRIAAIHNLSSMISITYFYSDIIFPALEGEPKEQENDEKTNLRSSKRLRGKICQILLGAVQDSRSAECQIKCFWGLIQVMLKELTQQKSASSEVKFILESLLSFLMDKNEKVATACHSAIMSLAYLELMPLLDEPNIRQIILQICQTISVTLNENRLVRGTLIVNLFYTLAEIMVSIPKGLVEQPQICQALFDAITTGLAAKSKSEEVDTPAASKKPIGSKSGTPPNPTPTKMKTVTTIKDENAKNISEAAEVLLTFIFNQLLHFPTPVGASIMSSVESELRYLPEVGGSIVPDPRIHHFIFNNYSLVTIMESPDSSETARIIMRDMTGKYCWDHKLSLTESASLFKRNKVHKQVHEEIAHATQEEATSDSPLLMAKDEEDEQPQMIIHHFEENQEQTQQQQQEPSNELTAPVDEDHQNDDEDDLANIAPAAAMHEEHSEHHESKEIVNLSLQTPVGQEDQVLAAGEDDDILDITPASEHESYHAAHNEAMYQQQHSRPTVDLDIDEGDTGDDSHYAQQSDQMGNDGTQQGEQGGDESYPKYDPLIDTDKTDMLEVLQHFVSQTFIDCDPYATPSVTEIVDQNINYPPIEKAIDEQSTSERALLTSAERRPFFLVERPPKQENEVFRVFRAFLHNLGFLSSVNRQSLSQIDANHKFFRTLKQLDKTPERETMKIGVIYVKNKQEKEKVIMKNDEGSPLYNEFIQTLGWDIDLKTHMGFVGGLDNSSTLATGKYAPYYANPTTEVVFHVVSNMPTKENDSQQIHKKRHVGNDFVHIVWSEHDRDYRPWTIVSQFNNVHIVIYPLRDPFFRIQIFTKPDVALFGPLIDGMVVDKQHLGPLVRLTAINANRAVRYAQQGYKKPYPTRRDMLNEICERFKKQSSNEEFMRPLFFDQIGKLSAISQAQFAVEQAVEAPETPATD